MLASMLGFRGVLLLGGWAPYHQEFQAPKMEGFLNLTAGYFGIGGGEIFPYISRIHTAYICEDSSILGT